MNGDCSLGNPLFATRQQRKASRVTRSRGPRRPGADGAGSVRRGEDRWGGAAGRRLRLAALPSATTASAVVPASVAGPAKP